MTHRVLPIGNEVVIEEYLTGPEISVLAFSDGFTIVPLPAAQDHKRIGEGDTGLNTGGMGAYAPAPVATPEIMSRITTEVLRPTIDGMRREGSRSLVSRSSIDPYYSSGYPFVGLLFTGFILTESGPKVLEYNVRFGDPETEALMLLLSDETDLAAVLLVSESAYLAVGVCNLSRVGLRGAPSRLGRNPNETGFRRRRHSRLPGLSRFLLEGKGHNGWRRPRGRLGLSCRDATQRRRIGDRRWSGVGRVCIRANDRGDVEYGVQGRGQGPV